MASKASRPVTERSRSRWIVTAGLIAANLFAARPSAAQLADPTLQDPAAAPPTPPPITARYLQYGVALTGEAVAAAGQVCPRTGLNSLPCILGDGGGLAVRMGYRSRGPWYVGGAYEFSRQDSSNLLRLGILQQLRGEARLYFSRVTRLSPYLGASFGGAVYGNEWGIDTWGVVGAVGAGVEFQVTPSIVLNVAMLYRQLWLRRWTDGADAPRATGPLGFGLAHIVAFEFGFEIRDQLSRW